MIRSEELVNYVSPWSEYEKVGHLLNGIADGILNASNNTIISDPNGLWSNFAKGYYHISNFIESATASNLGENRNVYELSGDCSGRN